MVKTGFLKKYVDATMYLVFRFHICNTFLISDNQADVPRLIFKIAEFNKNLYFQVFEGI